MAILGFSTQLSADSAATYGTSSGKLSLSILAQLVLSSHRSIEARFQLPEHQYSVAKSSSFLDWKEGHGIKHFRFDDPQNYLYEDEESRLNKDPRCIIHTNYIKEYEGLRFSVDPAATYFMEAMVFPTSSSDGNYFSLDFMKTQEPIEQISVTCVGLDPNQTTLDQLTQILENKVQFK